MTDREVILARMEPRAGSVPKGGVQRFSNLVASVFVIVVVVALGVHAYGSFTGSGSKAAASAGAIEKGTIQARIKGLAFPDGTRTVAVGTTIVWTNVDGATHTVTASDKSFDSGNLNKGQTYSRKFTAIGKYDYACKIHPFMKASITVVQPYGGG